MFLSLSTWIYQDLPVEDTMQRARRNGFDAVEISGDTWVDGWTWPGIVDAAARNDVRIASVHCIHHAPHENRVMRQQGYNDYHKRLYDLLAAQAPAPGLLLVEHAPPGPFEEVVDQAVEELGELVRLGQEFGLRVATENMPSGLTSPDHMRHLLDRVPGLLWTFDAGHAQSAGVAPMDFAPLFDERLANVHVIDIHPSVRLGDWLPTGLGVIDWHPIVSALAASDFDGPLTVELTARQLREVIAICDQVLAADGGAQTALGDLPWEDLFVRYARTNLVETCATQAVATIA